MLLGEAGSERLSDETARAELLSSVLLVLEARRTLIRFAREGALATGDYETCLGESNRIRACWSYAT